MLNEKVQDDDSLSFKEWFMLHGKYQISDEEKAKRAYVVRGAIASVQLEGLMLDDRIKETYNNYVNGNLTLEETKIELDGIKHIPKRK